MKVLVVMGTVFPEQLSLWGACRRAGIDLRILGSGFRAKATALRSTPGAPGEIPTVLASPWSPARNRGHLWWMYRQLGGLVRRMRPDVIHVLSEPWGALPLQSVFLGGRTRTAVPVSVHAADNIFVHGSKPEQLARQRILASVLPRLAGFVGWTGEVVQLARRFGLPESTPSLVIPAEASDPDRFVPVTERIRQGARRRLGLAEDHYVVGFLGRLTPEKGVLDAVAAVKGVRVERPTTLAVWGIGPLVKPVQAQQNGRCRYMGPLDLANVPTALQACDVVLMPSKAIPSWKEQFGRVAVEAMMSGCAVVAYRSGSLPSVLDSAGVLVDEGDVGGLVSALQGLLEDPRERSWIGRRARESAVQRFHPQILAGRIIEFWSDLVRIA
jgi:glycosyltransferase involved in cell wall biosynthesis